MGLFDLFGNRDERRDTPLSNTSDLGKIAMLGLPIILMALNERNKDAQKAEEFKETLSRHEAQTEDSIFDRIQNADREDGDKILGHILGDKKSDVIDQIAQQAGVSREEAERVMAQVSPSVLEQIAQETKEDRSVDAVRRSTEKQLEDYQNHPGTFDLNDLKGLFNENLLGGLLKNLFK